MYGVRGSLARYQIHNPGITATTLVNYIIASRTGGQGNNGEVHRLFHTNIRLGHAWVAYRRVQGIRPGKRHRGLAIRSNQVAAGIKNTHILGVAISGTYRAVTITI